MLVDIAVGISITCLLIGLCGLLWENAPAGLVRRIAAWSGKHSGAARGKVVPPGAETSPSGSDDRRLYERAVALVRENRIVDGAKLLEELGLNREAAAVLERGGMIHESAAVFLRRKRYHRAAEVYARHQMWEQAGSCYMLAASAMRDRLVKSPAAGRDAAPAIVNTVDTPDLPPMRE